jgi:predicted PurR-regulated permease PerM
MDQGLHDRSVARKTTIVIGLVLLTALGLLVVYEVRRVLIWMLIAVFFAIALNPVVNWVESRARWCKRWLATLLVYLAAVVVIVGLLTLFVVPLVREGTQLVHQFPQMISDAQAGRGPLGGLNRRFHIGDWIEHHRNQLQHYATGAEGRSFAILRGAATTIAALVTIFILSYLMVLEAPRIIEVFLSLFEPRRAERIRRVSRDCSRSVTGYISGNLVISVICGALTFVVLLVLKVPYAGLLAVFVGIADLIPLVGATLGAVVAIIAGFIHSIPAGIAVAVFFILYQQVENHLLQPIVLSRAVKLNPLTVLVAILIGVELLGLLGALLAIPAAGMVQIIARDVRQERRGRPTEAPTMVEPEHQPTASPSPE